MELFYDLHIHSCLSPDGADSMTPNNIVRMAKLAGLDVIAICDHNSARNCGAALAVGERTGVLVVPAIEVTCAEDVHVLCYFESLASAEDFCELLYSRLPKLKNRPQLFGRQLVLDEEDRLIEEEERLLFGSTDIGVYEISSLAKSYGGLAVPAHIDRKSFSLLSHLGFAEPQMGFKLYELSRGFDSAKLAGRPDLAGSGFIVNSDAHDLDAIWDASQTLRASAVTAKAVIEALRAGSGLEGRL